MYDNDGLKRLRPTDYTQQQRSAEFKQEMSGVSSAARNQSELFYSEKSKSDLIKATSRPESECRDEVFCREAYNSIFEEVDLA